MSRDPEKFFVIDYMEGTCGSFILTALVNSLTGEIIRDDYDNGTGHGHFQIYTRENLDWSLAEKTNNGFDLKLQDSSKHNFAIHRGIPRTDGPPFAHSVTIVNDFFKRKDFPKNLKWIFLLFNREDRLFFQTLHFYKCDWTKYQRWFANYQYINPAVKSLFKDETVINDTLPYELVLILLEEYWRTIGEIDQTFILDDWNNQIRPYIPEHLKDSFCTINISNIFCNHDMIISDIMQITGMTNENNLRYLCQLYTEENIKLFKKYNILFYNEKP